MPEGCCIQEVLTGAARPVSARRVRRPFVCPGVTRGTVQEIFPRRARLLRLISLRRVPNLPAAANKPAAGRETFAAGKMPRTAGKSIAVKVAPTRGRVVGGESIKSVVFARRYLRLHLS